jgi:hypothetical protein
MLNRTEIWRVCWPWQYINVVFVQNMTDNSCCMWAGIIVLKSNAWSVLTQKWNHYRLNDLISIPLSGDVPIHNETNGAM